MKAKQYQILFAYVNGWSCDPVTPGQNDHCMCPSQMMISGFFIQHTNWLFCLFYCSFPGLKQYNGGSLATKTLTFVSLHNPQLLTDAAR